VAITPELGAWLVENLNSRGTLLGEGYQAQIRRISIPAGEVVVKSSRRNKIFTLLARRAIRREYAAYQRLAGIAGIPKLHGLIAGDQLVLEFIDGPPMRTQADSLADRDRFFARLLDSIQAMHAAGVAHGDLKRKDNIVVSAGEQPYIIDFGIARLSGGGKLSNWIFEFVRQLDLNAWIKLKYGRRREALSAKDAALYRPLLLERLARWVRIPWQKITLRQQRQKLRQRRREQTERKGKQQKG